ncbi:MAG: DUF6786 family protein [Rikenellaceae bacterium]
MEKNYLLDKNFIEKHLNAVELKSGDKRVLLSPALQGRVVTSSATGDSGYSFGWINYKLIESGKFLPHCNNFGGEDRFWLGPEGGQFSLFFPKGTDYSFDDWQTPAAIDTQAWDLVSNSDSEANFIKKTDFLNTSGNTLSVELNRKVSLVTKEEVEQLIGRKIEDSVEFVAFKSENSITNCGENEWNKESGMPSIWILGQFISSDKNSIIIPTKESETEQLNDSYFGKIDDDRLSISEGVVEFKGDGKKRGKIGVPPSMTIPVCGAIDRENDTLTVVKFSFDENNSCYVNSMWQHQDEPFKGDVINSYNDGPLEDGTIMGPFYELETSSPAANLKPTETLSHTSVTIHFKGEIEALEAMLTLFK